MYHDTFPSCDLRNLFSGLDSANFVVCMHYSYQYSVRRDSLFHIRSIQKPVFVDRQISLLDPIYLSIFADCGDCGMLHLRSYDVIALVMICGSDASYRMIVRSAAAREDYLFRLAPEQRCNLRACCFNSLSRLQSVICDLRDFRSALQNTASWPQSLQDRAALLRCNRDR